MPSAFSWPMLVPSSLRLPAPVNQGVRLFSCAAIEVTLLQHLRHETNYSVLSTHNVREHWSMGQVFRFQTHPFARFRSLNALVKLAQTKAQFGGMPTPNSQFRQPVSSVPLRKKTSQAFQGIAEEVPKCHRQPDHLVEPKMPRFWRARSKTREVPVPPSLQVTTPNNGSNLDANNAGIFMALLKVLAQRYRF